MYIAALFVVSKSQTQTEHLSTQDRNHAMPYTKDYHEVILKKNLGWVLGLAVKIPTSHSGVPKSDLRIWFLTPASC